MDSEAYSSSREIHRGGEGSKMDRKGAETALQPENVGLGRRGLEPKELRPAWLRLGRAGQTWGVGEGARGGKDHRLDRGCMALTFWLGSVH
jgi:hypothetical protein